MDLYSIFCNEKKLELETIYKKIDLLLSLLLKVINRSTSQSMKSTRRTLISLRETYLLCCIWIISVLFFFFIKSSQNQTQYDLIFKNLLWYSKCIAEQWTFIIFTLHIVSLSVCLFVCLYPINVKMAEMIGPNFFVGPHMTPGNVYGCSKLKHLCTKVFYFCKRLKITKNIFLNPQTFFVIVSYCTSWNRRWARNAHLAMYKYK